MGQKRNIMIDQVASEILQKIIDHNNDGIDQEEFNIETSSMQSEEKLLNIKKYTKREKQASSLFSPDPLKRSHTLNKRLVHEVTEQERKAMEL
jgi:hypothetical protein